jgi:hypothetical protein
MCYLRSLISTLRDRPNHENQSGERNLRIRASQRHGGARTQQFSNVSSKTRFEPSLGRPAGGGGVHRIVKMNSTQMI